MNDKERTLDSSLRRTVLKAGAVAAGTLGVVGSTAATDHDHEDEDDDYDNDNDDVGLDEPEGFEVEILAGHAPFTDDVAAMFTLDFAGVDEEEGVTIGSHLDDASTLIVAEVTLEPGGTSGWHFHPGAALVNIVEGEFEVTWEHDCITRTYTEGEAFLDPGEVHIADNASDDEGARAYVIFLGVPDGEPATEWVEPVDC